MHNNNNNKMILKPTKTQDIKDTKKIPIGGLDPHEILHMS